MSGDPTGSWDVQAAVPLTAIFFLEQAVQDRADPVGRGGAVCMLVQSVEQAAFLRWDRPDQESSRRLRLKRFDNVCALAQSVPAFRLVLSLTGAFWTEIERVLEIEQLPLETLT
jgi:SynChlorMet cassette protein ScmC